MGFLAFHRWLDGEEDVPIPEDWLVSRICEEFGCVPSVAVRELTEDSERRALTILELRAYANTKAAVEAAKMPSEVPVGRMADLVQRVEVDVWRARTAEQRARDAVRKRKAGRG